MYCYNDRCGRPLKHYSVCSNSYCAASGNYYPDPTDTDQNRCYYLFYLEANQNVPNSYIHHLESCKTMAVYNSKVCKTIICTNMNDYERMDLKVKNYLKACSKEFTFMEKEARGQMSSWSHCMEVVDRL